MAALRHIFPIVMAALVFYFTATIPHGSWVFAAAEDEGTPAVGAMETVDAEGNKVSCGTVEEAKGGVLLGRIVPCVAYAIGAATENFTAAMVDLLAPVFYAYLAFVVTMFGVKILQGGQQEIHKEGFLLLVKIALVIGFLEAIPHVLVPQVYEIMSESQAIVAGTIGTTGMNCEIDRYQGNNTPLVWAQMDCVMGKLYGFTTGSEVDPVTGERTRNMFLAASVFGMLSGFFFGGAFGIAVFVGMIAVLISVFLLVLRTALAFLNGYLLISLMLIISPIFLPLVLMRVTSNYFDSWWKNILSGFLTPVLVTAFAMFALLIYDKMLFEAPDPAVPGSGALINKLFDYDQVKDAQRLPAQGCSVRISNEPERARPVGSVFGAPTMQTLFNPLLGAANDLCALFKIPVLNLPEGSPAFADAKENFKRLFNDCMKLLILAVVIHAGLEQVMSTIRQLTGTSSSSNLLDAVTPQEQKFNQALRAARSGAEQAMRDADGRSVAGAQFIARGPETIRQAAEGFIGAIRR